MTFLTTTQVVVYLTSALIEMNKEASNTALVQGRQMCEI